MGKQFGVLILNVLIASMNGQVQFNDMWERQMSADFIWLYKKTEIQLLSQKIERMVMKKIDDMDVKMSNMI